MVTKKQMKAAKEERELASSERMTAKRWLILIFGIILAGVVRAIGIYSFIVPNNFAPGGVTGIASMLENKLPGNPNAGYFLLAINIPLIIVAFIFIGKKFAIISGISILLSSALMVLFEKVGFPTFPFETDKILPAIAGGMPTGVFLIRTFFSGVPDSVFEAAELDGAGHIRRYLTLALPLSMPILFTIGLSTLLGAWNDIIWARLILYGKENLYTISVGVFVSFNSSVNKSITDTVVYAGYCIASLPLVLVFALTSKQFIKGLTSGAIKM